MLRQRVSYLTHFPFCAVFVHQRSKRRALETTKAGSWQPEKMVKKLLNRLPSSSFILLKLVAILGLIDGFT